MVVLRKKGGNMFQPSAIAKDAMHSVNDEGGRTMSKKLISLLLALVLVLTATAALAATEVIITGTNGPGDTQSMAHEEWARRLNEMGGWDAKALVSSEMGNTDDVLEAGMMGEPLIASSDPSRIAAYCPGIGILMMPYLLDSYDQLDGLMETLQTSSGSGMKYVG